VSVTDPITPAPPPSRDSSTKIVATIVVLIAFACGVAVGVFGDHVWMMHHGGRARREAIHVITSRVLSRLDRELDLTPQQHTQVKAILDLHAKRVQNVFDAVHPEIRREIELGNDEIRRVLTPEQRAKYEKLRMHLMPLHRGPGLH
jgi:Spy/CpxP family protein refolding chaperone